VKSKKITQEAGKHVLRLGMIVDEKKPNDADTQNFKVFYSTIGRDDDGIDFQVFNQVAFYFNTTTQEYQSFVQDNLYRTEGHRLSDAGNIGFTSQGTNLIFTDLKTKEMKTFLSTGYNQRYQDKIAETGTKDEEVDDETSRRSL